MQLLLFLSFATAAVAAPQMFFVVPSEFVDSGQKHQQRKSLIPLALFNNNAKVGVPLQFNSPSLIKETASQLQNLVKEIGGTELNKDTHVENKFHVKVAKKVPERPLQNTEAGEPLVKIFKGERLSVRRHHPKYKKKLIKSVLIPRGIPLHQKISERKSISPEPLPAIPSSIIENIKDNKSPSFDEILKSIVKHPEMSLTPVEVSLPSEILKEVNQIQNDTKDKSIITSKPEEEFGIFIELPKEENTQFHQESFKEAEKADALPIGKSVADSNAGNTLKENNQDSLTDQTSNLLVKGEERNESNINESQLGSTESSFVDEVPVETIAEIPSQEVNAPESVVYDAANDDLFLVESPNIDENTTLIIVVDIPVSDNSTAGNTQSYFVAEIDENNIINADSSLVKEDVAEATEELSSSLAKLNDLSPNTETSQDGIVESTESSSVAAVVSDDRNNLKYPVPEKNIVEKYFPESSTIGETPSTMITTGIVEENISAQDKIAIDSSDGNENSSTEKVFESSVIQETTEYYKEQEIITQLPVFENASEDNITESSDIKELLIKEVETISPVMENVVTESQLIEEFTDSHPIGISSAESVINEPTDSPPVSETSSVNNLLESSISLKDKIAEETSTDLPEVSETIDIVMITESSIGESLISKDNNADQYEPSLLLIKSDITEIPVSIGVETISSILPIEEPTTSVPIINESDMKELHTESNILKAVDTVSDPLKIGISLEETNFKSSTVDEIPTKHNVIESPVTGLALEEIKIEPHTNKAITVTSFNIKSPVVGVSLEESNNQLSDVGVSLEESNNQFSQVGVSLEKSNNQLADVGVTLADSNNKLFVDEGISAENISPEMSLSIVALKLIKTKPFIVRYRVDNIATKIGVSGVNLEKANTNPSIKANLVENIETKPTISGVSLQETNTEPFLVEVLNSKTVFTETPIIGVSIEEMNAKLSDIQKLHDKNEINEAIKVTGKSLEETNTEPLVVETITNEAISTGVALENTNTQSSIVINVENSITESPVAGVALQDTNTEPLLVEIVNVKNSITEAPTIIVALEANTKPSVVEVANIENNVTEAPATGVALEEVNTEPSVVEVANIITDAPIIEVALEEINTEASVVEVVNIITEAPAIRVALEEVNTKPSVEDIVNPENIISEASAIGVALEDVNTERYSVEVVDIDNNVTEIPATGVALEVINIEPSVVEVVNIENNVSEAPATGVSLEEVNTESSIVEAVNTENINIESPATGIAIEKVNTESSVVEVVNIITETPTINVALEEVNTELSVLNVVNAKNIITEIPTTDITSEDVNTEPSVVNIVSAEDIITEEPAIGVVLEEFNTERAVIQVVSIDNNVSEAPVAVSPLNDVNTEPSVIEVVKIKNIVTEEPALDASQEKINTESSVIEANNVINISTEAPDKEVAFEEITNEHLAVEEVNVENINTEAPAKGIVLEEINTEPSIIVVDEVKNVIINSSDTGIASDQTNTESLDIEIIHNKESSPDAVLENTYTESSVTVVDDKNIISESSVSSTAPEEINTKPSVVEEINVELPSARVPLDQINTETPVVEIVNAENIITEAPSIGVALEEINTKPIAVEIVSVENIITESPATGVSLEQINIEPPVVETINIKNIISGVQITGVALDATNITLSIDKTRHFEDITESPKTITKITVSEFPAIGVPLEATNTESIVVKEVHVSNIVTESPVIPESHFTPPFVSSETPNVVNTGSVTSITKLQAATDTTSESISSLQHVVTTSSTLDKSSVVSNTKIIGVPIHASSLKEVLITEPKQSQAQTSLHSTHGKTLTTDPELHRNLFRTNLAAKHFGFRIPSHVKTVKANNFMHHGTFVDPKTLVAPQFRSFIFENDLPEVIAAKIAFFKTQEGISSIST